MNQNQFQILSHFPISWTQVIFPYSVFLGFGVGWFEPFFFLGTWNPSKSDIAICRRAGFLWSLEGPSGDHYKFPDPGWAVCCGPCFVKVLGLKTVKKHSVCQSKRFLNVFNVLIRFGTWKPLKNIQIAKISIFSNVFNVFIKFWTWKPGETPNLPS